MNAKERTDFILDLIASVRNDICVEKVEHMPDHWDGEELRRYIADRFEAECNLLARGKVRSSGSSRRLADYHREVALRGL